MAEQQALAKQKTVEEPEEYVPSPVTSVSNDSYQPSSTQYQPSTTQYQPSSSQYQPSPSQYQPSPRQDVAGLDNGAVQETADETGGELQSMSWPPRHSPATAASGTVEKAHVSDSSSFSHITVNESPPAIVRPQVSMSSPIRPPNIRSNVSTVVQTIAPHIQITTPINSSGRDGSHVVMVGAPPPPPTSRVRTLSNEQQRDALNLLDSIHAETTPSPSRNETSAGRTQGNPIQTLGKNISPVTNRTYPVMNRPPVPPYYNNYNNYRPPPAKRPYQQYGNNYYY